MKKFFIGAIALSVFGGMMSCTSQQHSSGWKLVWEDSFEGETFDTLTWSKVPRWHPEWARHMSDNECCYEVKDGNLILKGVMNPNREADTAMYITGGVYTKYKRAFHGGRLEVKAKLQGARGAWPAIWLKPFEEEKYPWPTGGEIDIMERLNYDSIVYQTVHSVYTQHLNIRNNPPQGNTAAIRPDDYNVYAVEMYPDSVVFYVNDCRTFSYPRIKTDKEGQFPFDKPYYLLIDMQLGGNWVGKVDTLDLPVEMHVDWVRYYQWEPGK
ncbi:glycoside hydrolase family 16 protein [Phocaeicola barnesiae]